MKRKKMTVEGNMTENRDKKNKEKEMRKEV